MSTTITASAYDISTNLKASLAQIRNTTNLSTWTLVLATVLTVGVWLRLSRQNDSKKNLGYSSGRAVGNGTSAEILKPLQVRVSRILIHPIKSCRGISVQKALYTPEGMEFDRLWAIIDTAKQAIITAREVPKMVLITPQIERDDSSPHLGRLVVSVPLASGTETFSIPLRPSEDILRGWEVLPQIRIFPNQGPVDGYICNSLEGRTPSDVLSDYFGKPVQLVYKGPRTRHSDPTVEFPNLKATAKYQDMYPLLVLSEESTSVVDQHIRNHVGTQGIDERWKTDTVVIERFRPNIVFSGGGPFAEDNWEEISIGTEDAPTITLVSKCTRCLLPNVSPETGERDAAVPYKVLMKFRTGLDPKQKLKPCVGCNAVPGGNGVVSVGDWVFVKKVSKPLVT
ncbi:hypothetical protein CC1G_00542 [Coprinopsis cinerea okayama7|uniref:MOSC domain-containing protein n=1 Tax=Coprinopsis cinerea (strain Okayama-7 / 130 / ATCC MYA-4618 / FGSC 9003) TaxID=240176 RepID=A8N3B8_COPC7|nr:hypothetical protein CC1G_00542 [Coprinopsis cinerea okayama7\|eukprot:XP_001829363.1 hypothetical protein CC1G_00542 [Coprinopsis cinerea okayama7\